ncbi:MAG TPA: hypothetical protein VJ577_10955 [Burkholderiaceae bacterium]|nr:hypothetical protein [Burkholderiaceae bacterium]
MKLHRPPSTLQTPSMRRQKAQIGQSMTEYLIVCAAISAAIGAFMADGSLYQEFAQAITKGYSRFSYAISLVL